MSYHYQINNDYFDSTSYLPQVQMHMHTGYDFYSNDPTALMTQAPQIGSISTASQQNSIGIQQHEQLQQQSNSEHVVPYGWRSDWTSPTNNINSNSNIGLNSVNVQSSWITPIQNGNSFEPTTGSIGIHDAFRQASATSFYLDPIPTSSNESRLIPNEKKPNVILNQSHPQKPTRNTPKPFRCLVCCKSFSQAANLTAHKRIHTGEKPFTCSVCHRPFSQSSSLVTHKRTHTGERPYPCAQCDKAFTDSSTLTKHLRTHTGQKPYGCPLCLMRFTQSGNLHRHMKTHKP